MSAISQSITLLRVLLRRWSLCVSGHITMFAALSLIPLGLSVGAAVDYLRMSRAKTQLQSIADSAALSAASASRLAGSPVQQRRKREVIAQSYISNAIAESAEVWVTGAPSVLIDESNVKVRMAARVPASFMNLANAIPGMTSKNRDMAVEVQSTVHYMSRYICLLALNPSASEALSVKGTVNLTAPDCVIQANSSSNSALYANGGARVEAFSICAVGNSAGSGFNPTPDNSCLSAPDPYSKVFATDYAATYDAAVVRSTTSFVPSNSMEVLRPGIYTGGIRVASGRGVELAPGVYFIKDGELEIRAGGTVAGTGVSIIFVGNSNAVLNVQGGGSFTIKAPASGVFAGIAVASHPSVVPSKSNRITGGGTIEMEGVVYFPTQTLAIGGNGKIGVGTKQFSMVADKFAIDGTGQLDIIQSADYSAAGLPPLKTTAQDKIVRLTK